LAVVVAVLAVVEMRPADGFDFRPMFQAGEAVLESRPVYDVPLFGYPPFAAVAIAPLAMSGWTVANPAYAVFQVGCAVAAGALLGASLFRNHRLVGGSAVALALLASQFFWGSRHLYNVSLVMVLPLVLVAVLWSRSRWTAGSLVLGLSVAVKPLLALLFLVPLARRRWRALTAGVGLVLALTVVGVLLSHDVDGVLDLPRRVVLGANDLGDVQIHNVSPNSIGIVYPALAPAMTALRSLLAAGIVVTLWRARRWGGSVEAMLVVTGVLALALPLVGTLSEVHYSILAFPMAVAMSTGRLGRPAQVLALLGLVLLGVGFHGLTDVVAAQIQLCAGQVVVMLAAFIAHAPHTDFSSLTGRPADKAVDDGLREPTLR
jgi:arabinofuranan 3-O-arabinosyltransferase